ncbi:MAG: hypothetical protein KF773_22175 [Deltaproteobacteria bacterium]|nr:hypothetical protein [Deltaproteobacteria bacterium]
MKLDDVRVAGAIDVVAAVALALVLALRGDAALGALAAVPLALALAVGVLRSRTAAALAAMAYFATGIFLALAAATGVLAWGAAPYALFVACLACAHAQLRAWNALRPER